MAWIDDRIWCHPKMVSLSDKAFRAWVNGCAYSSGFGLRGRLEPEHQRLVGAAGKVRAELIKAGAWDEVEGAAVLIHDWDEHNGKRDDRRERDRERKREQRKTERQSQGQSAGQSIGLSAGAARGEGSEGSEGKNLGLLRAAHVEQPPGIAPTAPTLKEIA